MKYYRSLCWKWRIPRLSKVRSGEVQSNNIQKDMIMKNTSRLSALLCIASLTALVSSCFPDSESEDLAIGAPPEVSFTVSPIAGKTNTYLLSSTGSDAFIYRWDLGDGSGEFEGTPIDTAYFPEKGSYTIKLLAVDKNGYGKS